MSVFIYLVAVQSTSDIEWLLYSFVILSKLIIIDSVDNMFDKFKSSSTTKSINKQRFINGNCHNEGAD